MTDQPSPPILSLVQAVHYFQRPGRAIEGTKVKRHEMFFELVTGGRGWIEQGGELRAVGPGDLLWHIPGEHAICKGDWQNPYSCSAIIFRTPEVYQRLAPRVTRWPKHEQNPNLFAGEATRLWIESTGAQPSSVAAYLYGRLAIAAEHAQARVADADYRDELQRVLLHIDENGGESLRVNDLAAVAGWSVSHLISEFKSCVGMTPYAYIESRRFEKAKSILLSSNESIQEIGRQVGLADAATFSRRFRHAVGYSPREFRNRGRDL